MTTAAPAAPPENFGTAGPRARHGGAGRAPRRPARPSAESLADWAACRPASCAALRPVPTFCTATTHVGARMSRQGSKTCCRTPRDG